MTPEEKAALDEVQNTLKNSVEAQLAEFKKSNSNEEIKNRLKSVELALKNADGEKAIKGIQEMLGDLKLQMDAIEEKSINNQKNIGLKQFIQDNSQVLKDIKEKSKTNAELTIKATQVASDITSGSDYAEFIPGTIRKPVRKPMLMDLFRSRAVSSEYIRYREEDTVTRDAKFVVACATSTHTTKKTWVDRTIQLAKIRDMADACIDMLDDYDWVEGELRQLINESLMLKAEYELLLGASTNPTDMLSINHISSEFNAANPLADFSAASGTPFKDANVEQLADAMAAQITIFGQENKWMPNSVLMNYKDFILYRNLKDANGNKLIKTTTDGTSTIAGMNIFTSPLVASNTMYVMDTTQGEILSRKNYTLNISYENRDNIEHETVTFVAHARMQFHVPTINQDAFMKCSDVAAAITAITAP